MASLMRRAPIYRFGLALLLLSVSWPAYAVMVGISTEELTRNSHIVVLGTVESVGSYRSADKRMIFSRAEIRVEETAKGGPVAERIAVEYDGGEVGGVGLRVSDMPAFVPNERVILFLKTGSSRNLQAGQAGGGTTFNLVGKAQGRYTIDENDVARKGGFALASGQDVVDNNIPYTELINKVKAVR
jgi:hypothetical protein